MAQKNSNLHQAKRAKNDEFYTQLTDIEKEMIHYRPHFKGKVIFCNCDDARESNFFKYFANNFELLGIKKLITTGYKENGHGVVLEYERDKRTAYERQNGICPITGEHYSYEEMEADHIVPWWMGGITTLDNLQMVWKHANRMKGGKV